jgi:hypothetical protein
MCCIVYHGRHQPFVEVVDFWSPTSSANVRSSYLASHGQGIWRVSVVDYASDRIQSPSPSRCRSGL